APQDARRGEGDVDGDLHGGRLRHDRAGRHRAEPERGRDRLTLPAEAPGRNAGRIFADVLRSAAALETAPTGDGPIEEDAVTGLDLLHATPDLADGPRPFVAEDLYLLTEEELVVGVADAAGLEGDPDFARPVCPDF